MGIVYKNTGKGEITGANNGTAGTSSQLYFTKGSQFNLQYPLNLDTSPEYGGNRVVFFINVTGNGKLSRTQDSGAATSGAVDYRNLATNIPQNLMYRSSGKNIKALVRGTADLTGMDIGVVSPMRRLIAAISLYMPNQLGTSYTTNWQEEDLQNGVIMDAYVGAGGKGLDTWKGSGYVSDAVIDALKAAGGVTATAVIAKTIANMSYIQKATRLTPGNAKAEQLFQGVDFRTFQLAYQFAPKSKDEAKAVLDIIRMFRHHMLPEYYDDQTFLFIYPSEFEVKYYKGSKENEYLEKQMTAVLTNCSVDYTPNQQFNTFEDGMPSQINMTLSFKELGIVSKETSPNDRSGL